MVSTVEGHLTEEDGFNLKVFLKKKTLRPAVSSTVKKSQESHSVLSAETELSGHYKLDFHFIASLSYLRSLLTFRVSR